MLLYQYCRIWRKFKPDIQCKTLCFIQFYFTLCIKTLRKITGSWVKRFIMCQIETYEINDCLFSLISIPLSELSFYCIVLHPYFRANIINIKKKKWNVYYTFICSRRNDKLYVLWWALSTSSIFVGREKRRINACLFEQPIFGK